MKRTPVLLFVMSLLLLLAACRDLAAQTPQVVVVTATPEPTTTANSGPTVPTWTPEPTWTPYPSPTPTKTPLPTPTPTLQELAVLNAPQCVAEYDSRQETPDLRRHTDGEQPFEVIASRDGTAFVKAGYWGRLTSNFVYWSYQPGPVRGTYACKEITYGGYPTPTPVAHVSERIAQVAQIANEACRAWAGRGFFWLEEIRPATETVALVRMRHETPSRRYSTRDGMGFADWKRHPDRFLVYNAIDNTCEETDYATTAWQAWPDILPEIRDLTPPSSQAVATATGTVPTKTIRIATGAYEISGPTAVMVGNRYQYLLAGPANTEIYVRWYKDGQGVGGGSYALDDNGTDTAEWNFTEAGEYTVNIYLSGASGEQPEATLSGIISSTP